jgi:hypothetical protein
MADKNLNTAGLREKSKPEAEIKREMEKAAKELNAELVEVLIPSAYASGLGDPVMFSVNGVRVEIPVGEKIKVPKPHALHVERLMRGTVLTKNQRQLSPEEIYKD